MAKVRKEELKREAVRIALTSGQSRRQVAADLGVRFSMFAKWIQKSRLVTSRRQPILTSRGRMDGFAKRTVC
jgi:transposase-like protein